jgi:hypothetical protein
MSMKCCVTSSEVMGAAVVGNGAGGRVAVVAGTVVVSTGTGVASVGAGVGTGVAGAGGDVVQPAAITKRARKAMKI